MVCKNFNGIIDKVSALITYQSKQTTKPHENEFIDEFCCHNHCIGAQHLCFHPLGGVISGYQNVFFFGTPTYGFDWVDKIQLALHETFC
jgi:hypothetical protein